MAPTVMHCILILPGEYWGPVPRPPPSPLAGPGSPLGLQRLTETTSNFGLGADCAVSPTVAATNMTGVLTHDPKVTVISLRPTCDSVRTPGCTASQIETDLRIVTDFARANGVTIFVQTPQPCECDPKTAITSTVRKVYSWVKANYPNNYIDMTTDFSLPDGTINMKYFENCSDYNTAGQTLAYQRLKAKLGL